MFDTCIRISKIKANRPCLGNFHFKINALLMPFQLNITGC